jgi:aspartate aminotransferase-like enzyme
VQLVRQNLRTPGPTPCPDEVLQAMSMPMINHRGPEFKDLIFRLTGKLKTVFQTQNDLVILTASGSGCLEAAVVSTLSPGDKVLAISIGAFGDRFASIAKIYGADVTKLDVEWGTPADPDQVRQALSEDAKYTAVLVTHNETSTGVTNDLEAISNVVKKEFNKLLLVDAVSSLGCLPIPVDQWCCDVVVTASQKGMMVPPGLGFVSVSSAAWEAYNEAKMPRFYFDLGVAKRYLDRGQTPWTPSLPLMYGLNVALDRMLNEGLENIYRRHASLGNMTREAIKDMGLSLLCDGANASNTVTAAWVPEGVDGKALLESVRNDSDVVLAGGQGKLDGKIFRIGHMGHVSEDDISESLIALKAALKKAGGVSANSPGG